MVTVDLPNSARCIAYQLLCRTRKYDPKRRSTMALVFLLWRSMDANSMATPIEYSRVGNPLRESPKPLGANSR